MMDDQNSLYAYRAALKFIDAQRRLLHDARADENILRAYDAIIRHLNRLPPSQVDRLLGKGTTKNLSRQSEEMTKKAAEMSLSEVEQILDDPKSSRQQLEALAIGRFRVPKGSMRSLGNLEHLKQTILTFVQNERAHQSIREMGRDKA